MQPKPVTKVENKAPPCLISNLRAALALSIEPIPNTLCYRAIENQNVLMMFLVAAR
jgi:hypothetical protein